MRSLTDRLGPGKAPAAGWGSALRLQALGPGSAVAVRAGFEAVFASNGRIQAQPERVRRVHSLDSAVHNLVERIELQTAEGARTGFVVATNVYIKTAQGWRMVAHHASPGTAQETPEIVEAPSVLH